MTATTPERIQSHYDRQMRCEKIRTASGTHLIVFGELDIDVADLLVDALADLERTPDASGVNLKNVTFADSWGLEPIVEAIRRSVMQRGIPLRICCAAPAVQRIFDCLRVQWRPFFDLDAWDAAGNRWPSEVG
jgi:anti-anti-sigma factor